MKPLFNHPWNISVNEAIELQKGLSRKIIKNDCFSEIKYIAGADVAYKADSELLTAAVVILDASNHSIIESITVTSKATFPYVSGLFSFRETPALLKAFKKVTITPDLIICDAQGYAHPRRFGLACHLGLVMDTPTIGCAKTPMIGQYNEPGETRGSTSNIIIDNNEIIGNAVRTQTNVNPVFVSLGHKISLETATEWVLKLSPKYRLPETTRLADQLSRSNKTRASKP